MRYFTSPDEDLRLDLAARRRLRGSFVELSAGITHYELAGPSQGDIAILIGGITVPLSYWDRLTIELHAQGLRTLAYSVYGRGYSDRVTARYDDAFLLRQLTELVDHVGLTGPHHMVGTSMGALIAMLYTCQNPGATATLTIAGPAGLGKPAAPSWLLRSDRLTELVAKRAGRRILEHHLSHNVRDPRLATELATMVHDAYRYEGSLYSLFATLQDFPLSGRHGLYRRTGASEVPTMLLWGTDDQVTPIAGRPAARALLSPRECHTLDCGHMTPYERPRDVAALLVSFATSHADRLNHE